MYVDKDILQFGSRVIRPFDKDLVQPSSIDVTLDKTFYAFGNTEEGDLVYPGRDNDAFFTKVEVPPASCFLLKPGDFALASTFEHFSIPENMAARFEGKSSLGRLGLFTHVTAGFIDPGFKGHITLELLNALPTTMALEPGMKIGQICFFPLAEVPTTLYGSKKAGSHYQGQRGPTRSRSHKNYSIKNVYSED